MAVVSLGLLGTVSKRSKDADCHFELGLGEWTESSEDKKENDPPAPQKKLKLTLEKPREQWHFMTKVVESDLQQKYVAKNTFKATKWVQGNFTQWRLSRNYRFACEPDKQVPEKLLECAYDPGVVSTWLALYIAETQKENGDCYPPKTLYVLLAGLLCYCQSKNPTCLNFLDTSDKRFQVLHNAMDNTFQQLRQKGVGLASKSAEAFQKKKINFGKVVLWECIIQRCRYTWFILKQ